MDSSQALPLVSEEYDIFSLCLMGIFRCFSRVRILPMIPRLLFHVLLLHASLIHLEIFKIYGYSSIACIIILQFMHLHVFLSFKMIVDRIESGKSFTLIHANADETKAFSLSEHIYCCKRDTMITATLIKESI